MNFRDRTPKRRNNPTIVSDYRNAKPELKEDFHSRCGYCNDHDYFKQTYYEVDHFVPRQCLNNISLTDYNNLIYSCRSCNNSKRAKWPTNDETIHNNGHIGFIDPCSEDYSKQFKRNERGEILPLTKLGEWMYLSLNFSNPSHRIIWTMERLRTIINKLSSQENFNDRDKLEKYVKFTRSYFSYEEQLKNEHPKF